jgi:hypothetical protein
VSDSVGGDRLGKAPAKLRDWRTRRRCFHHDRGGNPANSRPAFSWIGEQLIEMGTRKMFWCTECGKTWFS